MMRLMMGTRITGLGTVLAVAATLALAAPTAALAADGRSGDHPHGGKQVPVYTTITTPSAGSSMSAQGVVQSVSATVVVIKQLDGSTVSVPVDRKTTQIFVNNKHVQLSDVKPGYVLSATWKAGKAAPTLKFVRAF
jgi:hypothetical protein